MHTLRLLALGAVLAAAPLAHAQWLIAGWDFSNAPTNGNIAATAGLDAVYSDSYGDNAAAAAAGRLVIDGTYGSDLWVHNAAPTDNGLRTLSSSNTTTGSTIATERRTDASDVLYLKNFGTLGGQAQGLAVNPGATADALAFKLNTSLATGDDLTIQFAGTWSAAAGATGAINWFAQVGSAGPLTAIGSTSITASAFTPYSTTITGLSSLMGQNEVSIVGVLSGGSTSTFLRLDNIGFIASDGVVIPEPSTYALLVGAATLGFVALRRKYAPKA